jgi:hypothetical protein
MYENRQDTRLAVHVYIQLHQCVSCFLGHMQAQRYILVLSYNHLQNARKIGPVIGAVAAKNVFRSCSNTHHAQLLCAPRQL